MLALVLMLCAWTTASAYNLTTGTQTNCTISYTVGGSAATTAAEGATVTIVVTPATGYHASVDGITVKAYLSPGNAQTRTSLVDNIVVSPTANANAFTFTMPDAHVKVNVTCEADVQTVNAPDGVTKTEGTDPTTGKPIAIFTYNAVPSGGSYEMSPANPQTGETVTVIPKPNPGWEVDTPPVLKAVSPNADVPATGTDTNGDGKPDVYTFDQPPYGGQLVTTFKKTAYNMANGGSPIAFTNGTVAYAVKTRASRKSRCHGYLCRRRDRADRDAF